MNISKIVIFLMFGLVSLPTFSGVASLAYQEPIPESLEVKMELISKDQSGAIVMVTIKSLIGTIRNMEFNFHSAGRMPTQPSSATLPALQEGQQQQYEIKIPKTALNKKSESWLQLRVDYYRDHVTLRQRIAAYDPHKHPGMNQLLERLKKSEERGGKSREGRTLNF